MINLNALHRTFPNHQIIAHHGTNTSEHAILRAQQTGRLSIVELHLASDTGWQLTSPQSLTFEQAISDYVKAIEDAARARLESNQCGATIGNTYL